MMQGTENPSVKIGKQYNRDADDDQAGSAINASENYFDEIETIIGFDALYESMRKCTRGVIWKDSVANFRLNAIEKVINLNRKLENGTYKAKPPVLFVITSPKRREIASVAFTDRVFQRSLNDNVVYPIMSKSFIYDNFACQTGKGTDACRERLKVFLRKYYREHGLEGYVAQFDIHGYYPNMDHEMTEKTFEAKLSEEAYAMVRTILQEQYPSDVGYNPGSQLIQIAGISVLDKVDHYIKERLHARFYIRYMDDFMIISHDREYLERCMKTVVDILSELRFTVNPKKTRIYNLSEGIDFLGFHFKLTGTGKVLMQIRSKNVKAQRKKLRRLVKRSKNGLIPREKVNESYAAWRNHASKGNSYKLLQRMDSYYKNLWRDYGTNQEKNTADR